MKNNNTGSDKSNITVSMAPNPVFTPMPYDKDSLIAELSSVYAHKDDLSAYARKDDLSAYARKDDLSAYSRKDDVVKVQNSIDEVNNLFLPVKDGLNTLSGALGPMVDGPNGQKMPQGFVSLLDAVSKMQPQVAVSGPSIPIGSSDSSGYTDPKAIPSKRIVLSSTNDITVRESVDNQALYSGFKVYERVQDGYIVGQQRDGSYVPLSKDGDNFYSMEENTLQPVRVVADSEGFVTVPITVKTGNLHSNSNFNSNGYVFKLSLN